MTVALPPSENLPRALTRYAAPAPLEARPDDFDISSIFRLLRRRLLLICGLTILVTAALAPLIMELKPVYHAESRLMIRNSLGSILGAGDQERASSLDLPSETERLFSRGISHRVVADLKLDEREEFNPALRPLTWFGIARDKLRGLLGTNAETAAPGDPAERVIQEYYRALTVRRDAITNVIQIGFDSEDPALAAAVPNRLIEIYLDERKQSDAGRLGSAEELLRRRIADQQARLDLARAAVARFRESAGAVSAEAQAEQARSLAVLNDQLEKLRQQREAAAAAIAVLGAPDRDMTSPRLPLPEGMTALQAELRAQQRSLDQLLQTYGDKADEVVNQRASIAATTNTLGLEIDSYVRSQKAELEEIDQNIRKLRMTIALAEQRLSRSVEAQAELASLQAAADKEQENLYALELQRRSLADRASVPTAEVELLSPAAIPLQPQGRGRMFYLLGAFIGALSLAVTAAFLREMMDVTVHSHEDLHAMSGLVPAGLIPLAPATKRPSLDAMRKNQSGLFGESIRAAIVTLRQSNGGRLPGSILVTSAIDGEGKSFVALALAMELVAAKQPVLLVESDLVRGNLAAFFRTDDPTGFGEYLNGEVELADAIRHDEKTGIHYILRGRSSRLLRSFLPELSELKSLAQSRGLCLLIDSAPLLASTDTLHLAGQTERTLLVVRWAKTRLRTVEFAVQRLREASHGAIVVAINQVNTRKHRQYGYKDAEMYVKSLEKYYL